MRILQIIPAILIAFSTLSAQAQDAPKYSNEFLSIGIGARGLGMSGSLSASVNDVTAGYWNPAGLTLGKGDMQFGLMHAEYFAGIAKYDYAALAAPIDATRTIGLSLIRFAVDDIPDTIDLRDADGNINYDKLRSFSAADYAFLFSYSKITKINGLRYGVNAKVIHRKVGDFAKAWGFGLDAGLQYEKDRWRFGAMARDITSTFNSWSYNTERLEEVFIQTGNEIPENGTEITLPKLILGFSHITTIKDKFTIQPELDFDITFDGKRNVLIQGDPISVEPHLGLELGYNNLVFLRGGVGNIQKYKDFDGSESTSIQPNFGIGIKIKSVSIDYALTNIGSVGETLYSNIFSLKFALYKKKK